MVVASNVPHFFLSVMLRYVFLGASTLFLITSSLHQPVVSHGDITTKQVLPAAVYPSEIPLRKFLHPISVKIGQKEIPPTPTPKDSGQATATSSAPSAQARDLFQALNSYRQKKERGALSWSDTLASIARDRVETFVTLGKLDSHAGFRSNFDKMPELGFSGLGENSSFGHHLSATDIIEVVYGGHPPHDENQLQAYWTHVGIGVTGTVTDVVFGKK